MAHPRILALCTSIVDAVERNDGAALVRALAPFVDDPELDQAIAIAAASFPRLVARPDATWPQPIPARCLALVTAEMRQPRSDRCLDRTAPSPTTWNWLISIRDVLAGRDGLDLTALRTALEMGDVDAAARLLDGHPPDATLRAWQAVLITAALRDQGAPDTRRRAVALIIGALDRGDADLPPPVLAVLVADHAARQTPPPPALAKRLDALRPGHALDLTIAAALHAWSEVGPLSPTYAARVVVDPATQQIAIGSDKAGTAWLRLLRRLFKTGPASLRGIFGNDSAAEPYAADMAAQVRRLAEVASTDAALATTWRMANVLLLRLRRRDLCVAATASGVAPLASLLISPNVLAAIEQPPDTTERGVRLLAQADVAKIGEAVPLARPANPRITSARISICVVNHNQAETTNRLFVSLRRLWPSFEGDVLVFDNGSTEAEFEALLAHVLTLWPGRVRLFRSSVNLGPGPARNRLFAEVRTPWILSLDNDMIATADFGTRLLPLVAVRAASVFNLAYEELDHPGVIGVGKTWSIVDDGQGGQEFRTGFAAWTTDRSEPQSPRVVAANRLSGGAALFEVAAFRAAGGFAADNVLGYEDYEASLRLSDQGQPIETFNVPLMVHGHLAPARANDVVAVSGRFDRAQMDVSTKLFADIVKQRFKAHLGQRSKVPAPHRIVPRRLDFRHLDGPRFFVPVKPGAPTVAFLRDSLINRVVPSLLDWLDASGVNIEIRDEGEFVAVEQALLVMQACALIIAGPAVLQLSAARCAALGLRWPTPATAPRLVVLDPAHAAPAQDKIYAGGPRLTIVRDGEQLIAAIRTSL